MKKLGIVLFLALFVYAAPAPSPAPTLKRGVVFQVETTYHSGSGSGKSTMSVEKPNMKFEILPGAGAQDGEKKDEVIFRGDRRQMVVVDHRDKTYMVIDKETVEEIRKQLEGAREMAQKMAIPEQVLKQMPKEQREKLEKMLKDQKAQGQGGAMVGGMQQSKDEFRKTSERATKQGYPCVRYDVFRDGQKVRELWVTDWNNIKGGGELRDTIFEVADFTDELMKSFGEMTGSDGVFSTNGNLLDSFVKVGGFPVVTRSFEGGELESETVLESVTERDLDPDAFEPPKGYRLRTMGPK